MIVIRQGVIDATDARGGIFVSTADDYVEARRAIRDALTKKQDLDVYIMKRTYDGWFWDLEEVAEVRFVNEDPTERLRNKLRGKALPDYLTSDMILGLNLLEAPDPTSSIRDVSQWAGGVVLGDVWGENEPSVGHLSALISWWVNRGVTPLEPVAQPLADHRLAQWASAAEDVLRIAYEKLRKSPVQIIYFLCCHEALSTYDASTRDDWLKEKGWQLDGLERVAKEVSGLPIPAEVDRGLSVFVEAYWRRKLNEIHEKAQSEQS